MIWFKWTYPPPTCLCVLLPFHFFKKNLAFLPLIKAVTNYPGIYIESCIFYIAVCLLVSFLGQVFC